MLFSTGGYTPPAPSLAARDVALSSTEHFSGQLVIDDGQHGRVVVVESHLEMLWAVYLMSLPSVATIVEQAVFPWVNAKGEVVPKYFDFLVTLHSKRRLACEVKPEIHLKSGRVVAELREITAQMMHPTQDFADEVRLLTEKGLDRISTYNAEMFMGMRDADPEVDAAAWEAVRDLRGTASMADLTRLIGQGARGFRALVRLISKRVLCPVSHERISPTTLVALKEAF